MHVTGWPDIKEIRSQSNRPIHSSGPSRTDVGRQRTWRVPGAVRQVIEPGVSLAETVCIELGHI